MGNGSSPKMTMIHVFISLIHAKRGRNCLAKMTILPIDLLHDESFSQSLKSHTYSLFDKFAPSL